MRTNFFKLIVLLGVLIPLCSSAQTNVKKAFDELLKSSDVQYSETHSLEKDTETGVKRSQCDVYNFTLPASRFRLVENVLKAFKEDEDKAYALSSGTADKNSGKIVLAVGNGNGSSPTINPNGYDYHYALFLAPKSEDNTGCYRYAYAINWKKNKDKVEGSLIVTYATTLKYRQEATNKVVYSNGSNPENWFTTMVAYMGALSEQAANTVGQQTLAAKIFKQAQLSQNLKGISETDKEAARELLKAMISDTDKYDPLTLQLLKSAFSNLK